MNRFLTWVERTGNKLPHPFWLFIYLAGFILLASLIGGLFNVSVTHPVTEETIEAQNLISQYGLQRFVLEMVDTFANFPPLGLMLVMLMGVSLAVHSGLLETLLGRLTKVPDFMVYPVIVVTGIMGNLASDAGIVVVPPLAAVAFKKIGKSPLAGVILAYAACTAGFTATLIPRGTDVLLAGFTNSALEDPNMHVGAAANLYFMIASVFLLAIVMSWVGKKFTLPLCEGTEPITIETKESAEDLAKKKKGLRWSLLAMGIYTVVMLMTLIPENGLLRYDINKIETIVLNKNTEDVKTQRLKGRTVTKTVDGERQYAVKFKDQKIVLDDVDKSTWTDGATAHIYLPKGETKINKDQVFKINLMPSAVRGPFFRGMVAILFFFFAIPGTIYGMFVGRIKTLGDIPGMMTKSVKGIAGMIVLVLVISHFVVFFQWSNLDRIVAITGANILNQMKFQGPLLMVFTTLIVMILNIFMGSSSAKWAMLAPIIVPMFLYLENPISPAVSQLVYRIGDSITNGISPLYPYFPLALGWLREYRKDAGVGTLIRLLLPYAFFTGLAWIALLVIWYFLGIPVGPGQPIH
ncbi:MAG: AbgT family transporter [Fidelibacterota bacterium]